MVLRARAIDAWRLLPDLILRLGNFAQCTGVRIHEPCKLNHRIIRCSHSGAAARRIIFCGKPRRAPSFH